VRFEKELMSKFNKMKTCLNCKHINFNTFVRSNVRSNFICKEKNENFNIPDAKNIGKKCDDYVFNNRKLQDLGKIVKEISSPKWRV